MHQYLTFIFFYICPMPLFSVFGISQSVEMVLALVAAIPFVMPFLDCYLILCAARTQVISETATAFISSVPFTLTTNGTPLRIETPISWLQELFIAENTGQALTHLPFESNTYRRRRPFWK